MAVAKGNWICGSVHGKIRLEVVIQIHDSICNWEIAATLYVWQSKIEGRLGDDF